MIYGNMTINGPRVEEGQFVCLDCYEEFGETGVEDNSFDDAFGHVRDFHPCCPYCGGGNYTTGKIWLYTVNTHTARKDHYDKKGRLVVRKGKRYQATLVKGYTIDGWNRKGIFDYRKIEI